MHSIFTTPGFIIDSRAHAEADKVYYIFTRDMGLIRAVAQGIRLEKSKLRYHMEDYSFEIFSLVRGKEIWRLTSAQEFLSTQKFASTQGLVNSFASKRGLLARLALLLRRVLHGEEPNPDLFGHLLACAKFVDSLSISDDQISESNLQSLESVTVLRALHSLGYVGNDLEIREFLMVPMTVSDDISLPISTTSPEITIDLLAKATPKRAIINKHINKAIQESHL